MERVGDDLSLHTVDVPDNVGPCGRPDNSFDAEVAISENILWICTFPFAESRCAFVFMVSPPGCNVALVDVGTMVVEVGLMDFQSLSALVPVSVYFFCLTLWDCLSQIFHTCDMLVWHAYP